MFDITDKTDLVSICYCLWHNLGKRHLNSSEILEAGGNYTEFGAYHWWAEPALGYYDGENPEIYRQHLTMLAEAGVDFIICDDTNGSSTFPTAERIEILYKPAKVLLDTALAMKKEGKKIPYIVFWAGTQDSDPNPSFCGLDIYERFYKDHIYDDLFVSWDGKPLLLVTSQMPEALTEHFTIRKCWGLQQKLGEGEWSFLQPPPQNVGMKNGKPEQVSVCTATQLSYMTAPDAISRNRGKTFYEEWKTAFAVRPKVVTLTWWNEWIAICFKHEGKYAFVDNYNREYSRDIEPMKGGHGDLYYRWMAEYIKAYKAHEPIPQGLLEPDDLK